MAVASGCLGEDGAHQRHADHAAVEDDLAGAVMRRGQFYAHAHCREGESGEDHPQRLAGGAFDRLGGSLSSGGSIGRHGEGEGRKKTVRPVGAAPFLL